MNWLTNRDESFEDALALQPVLREKFRAFLSSVGGTGSVPGSIMVLCRARIAFIHGLVNEDVTASTDEEAVALAVADRMPHQHHQMEDDEVEAVRQYFGEAGCVALLTALAFFDVSCRLDLSARSGS